MSMGLSEYPLSYLSAAGTRADRILPLTWYLLWVAIAVCVIIAALLWIAVRRNPSAAASRTDSPQSIKDVPLVRGADPVRWISIGVSISAIPLVIALVWTMVALARTSGPPSNPALVLDVTGRQWWWEVRYDSAHPAEVFQDRERDPHSRRRDRYSCGCTAGMSSTASGCRSSPARPTPFRARSTSAGCRADRPAAIGVSARNTAARSTPTCNSKSSPSHAQNSTNGAQRQLAAAPAPATPDQAAVGSWSNTAAACVTKSAAPAPARFSARPHAHHEPPHACGRHLAQQSRKPRPAGSRIRRT